MAEPAKWYVVHTYSGYENKVMTNLEKAVENRKLHDLIQDVRIPLETVSEVKDNEVREVKRKLFPGYVLVKMVMTDVSWYVVRNIRGVTGFVGPASKPVPLTDEEVAALDVETKEVKVNYAVGDVVKIVDGVLSGFLGQIEKIEPEQNRVTVVVSMFGRETPVELELWQVQAQ
ncbi:MAG: transcription termination/antitermination factor NusG [Clostridia bacterium]|jgi:transcriptional antiterminator NusG|nr:transcription termination/antitermination factor NusG [Clostridia bacterium]